MRLLYAVHDSCPRFRVDEVELYCRGIARSGVTIDWLVVGETLDPAQAVDGAFGQRFLVSGSVGRRVLPRRVAIGLGRLLNQARGWWLALRGDYQAVQVRNLPFFAAGYLIAARLSGKKFVYWMSFPILEDIEQRARDKRKELGGIRAGFRIAMVRVCKPVFRFVLRHADHVFVQSEAMKAVVAADGVSPLRMTAVPMGVNTGRYSPETIPVANDPRAGADAILVYVGDTMPLRRVDLLVDALGQLVQRRKHAVLFIIGGDTGENHARLKARAEHSGLSDRVFFLGHLPLEQMLSYVRLADICLSPYPTHPLYITGTPTKLVEYLALGRPVVANDHPDQRAILDASGAGLSVAFTAEAFAGAIETLLDDPALRSQMAAAGPAWIRQNRSYDQLMEIVLAVYRNLGLT